MAPRYSPLARRANIGGTVLIRIHLDPDCGVQSVDAQSGPALLIDEVMNAAEKWRFTSCSSNNARDFSVRFSVSGEKSNDWAPTRVEYGEQPELQISTTSGDPVIYDFAADSSSRRTQPASQSILLGKPDNRGASPRTDSAAHKPKPGGGARAPATAEDHEVLGIKKFTLPAYPALARLARITGEVHATITLDSRCYPTDLSIADGNVVLRESVFRSLADRDWVFSCQSPSKFVMTFRFELLGEPTNEWRPTNAQIDSDQYLVVIQTNPPDLSLFCH